MISAWHVGVAANLLVSVAYLAIAWSILRPLLRERAGGVNVLGFSTAAIFLTCAVHHTGHAFMLAAGGHRHGGAVATGLVAWDVVSMVVGGWYWTLRRSFGGPQRGQLFRDLEAERAAAREHGVLREVATAVAADPPPEEVFALVAAKAAELTGAECGLVARFDMTDALVVGADGVPALGRRFAVAQSDAHELDADEAARWTGLEGFTGGAAAPVMVGDAIWGAVVVATTRPDGLASRDTGERLASFGDLVGLSVANAEARRRLAEAAATDALTGLANHRVFNDRLASECARAHRHGHPLSLLLLDIDFFKAVNDVHGHQVGDRVLVEVGSRLFAQSRQEDLVARIGGEEFAILMPDTSEMDAYLAAERIRRAISSEPFPEIGRLTVSGGICSFERAGSARDLARLADGALYWAKSNGRDVCFIYTPEVVEALSADERAEKLLRTRTFGGLRALAQAVDARGRRTPGHCERVADLAGRIAAELGWSGQDRGRLREAALLHDVGKVSVPAELLQQPGPLSAREQEVLRGHVLLGAQMAAEALDPEQVNWVRQHHERHDGEGYPLGTGGIDLTEGAAVLALADAWDAMTTPRPHRGTLALDRALDEVRAQRGAHFAPHVVDAFIALAAHDPRVAGGTREPAERG